MSEPIPGLATADATAAFAKRAVERGLPGAHFRQADALGGLTLSSIGLGTYLGAADDPTDAAMRDAAMDALAGGVNVLDAAINYRDEHSELSLGDGLRRYVAAGGDRGDVVVTTKGGFIVGTVPPGLVRADDVAMGCHAFSPDYIAWALGKSLRNLGLDAVDVYYVHNPEAQLERLGLDGWLAALTDAFQLLEARADDGLIGHYGVAMWSGPILDPEHDTHVPLERVVEAARDAGGADHRLRAAQMPLNLGMPHAIVAPTQEVAGERLPAVQAAAKLGLTVFTSGSTGQGRLAARLPPGFVEAMPGADGSATRALLQWARSCPGVTTALVGMTQKAHREEDLALVAQPLLDEESALGLVGRG